MKKKSGKIETEIIPEKVAKAAEELLEFAPDRERSDNNERLFN